MELLARFVDLIDKDCYSIFGALPEKTFGVVDKRNQSLNPGRTGRYANIYRVVMKLAVVLIKICALKDSNLRPAD
jgi:hypothetical protein